MFSSIIILLLWIFAIFNFSFSEEIGVFGEVLLFKTKLARLLLRHGTFLLTHLPTIPTDLSLSIFFFFSSEYSKQTSLFAVTHSFFSVPTNPPTFFIYFLFFYTSPALFIGNTHYASELHHPPWGPLSITGIQSSFFLSIQHVRLQNHSSIYLLYFCK